MCVMRVLDGKCKCLTWGSGAVVDQREEEGGGKRNDKYVTKIVSQEGRERSGVSKWVRYFDWKVPWIIKYRCVKRGR